MEPVTIIATVAAGAFALSGATLLALAAANPPAARAHKVLERCEAQNRAMRKLLPDDSPFGKAGAPILPCFGGAAPPDAHESYAKYQARFAPWDASVNRARPLAPYVRLPEHRTWPDWLRTAESRENADAIRKCELRGAWLRAALTARHNSAPGEGIAKIELWARRRYPHSVEPRLEI